MMGMSQRILQSEQRVQKQMRSHVLDAFDGISVIRFLYAIELVCIKNGINEEAAMSLFHIFVKGKSAAALNARLC